MSRRLPRPSCGFDRDQVFQKITAARLQTLLACALAVDLTWPTLDAILAVRAAKNQLRFFIRYGRSPADDEADRPQIAQRAIPLHARSPSLQTHWPSARPIAASRCRSAPTLIDGRSQVFYRGAARRHPLANGR